MSQRGRGYCSGCNAEYFNRSKPKNCAMCGFEIGGSFESASKKKKICPSAVKVSDCDFSVRTSNRDDRCFVSTNGTGLWICSVEECKVKRAVLQNSSKLESFSCKHVEEAKITIDTPLAILTPNLATFPCSELLKKELQELANSPVMQVSDSSFVVLGHATASNPLGYCHVQKSNYSGSYMCKGKDCRGFSSKAKQSKTKSMCHHVLLLRSCLSELQVSSTDSLPQPSSSVPCPPSVLVGPATASYTKSQTKRDSTITLAEKTKTLPYHIPRSLLREIAVRDACSLMNAPGGWPMQFIPERKECQLCGAELGYASNHPGQHSSQLSYLLTELNPFKRVSVKVKFCSNNECLAMHQASVEILGLFNISDKVLISFNILLELREFFKKGQPIGNVIGAKLAALQKKCREEDNPTDNEITYLEDLVYNGFICFEMIAVRSLDDVVCAEFLLKSVLEMGTKRIVALTIRSLTRKKEKCKRK